MIPDSVHLLTRSSQMTLYKDEQGRVRRAYYGPRLHQPEDALETPRMLLSCIPPWRIP